MPWFAKRFWALVVSAAMNMRLFWAFLKANRRRFWAFVVPAVMLVTPPLYIYIIDPYIIKPYVEHNKREEQERRNAEEGAKIVAEMYEEGQMLYFRGDHCGALTIFEKLKDHAGALYYKGRIYHASHPEKCVPNNKLRYKEAASFYVEALEEAEAAGEQHIPAQYYYYAGLMYDIELKHFPPSNPAQAIKHYRKAAQAGHVKAQFNLGRMYREGRGGSTDVEVAYMWLYLALQLGHQGGKDKLDAEAQLRDMALQSEITSGKIVKAKERAWQCLADGYKGCE